MPTPHLIVFSHLRWNFIRQRPQHLLSRLARHYHIVFVEEPIRGSGRAYLELTSPIAHVDVLRPHTPIAAGGFHDDQLPALEFLLANHLADNRIDDPVVWFYTPMALPLVRGLAPRAIVYDCINDLAALDDAPRQMRQRENALLKSAELVLAAGPSLYEAKRALHPNVLCLPSAVDAQHYAPAGTAASEETMWRRALRLQDSMPAPRLGFFGTIDGRLDLELVAEVADAEPSWQLEMVGPVAARIDPTRLPRRANVHWLGRQPYDLLPQLVAAWDVCLMPFAINNATRYLSPTQALEYMAAGKPIVSTGVHDVKAMFSDVVAIATDTGSFIDACRAALAESAHARNLRLAEMQACVWRYSWDETAAAVQRAIEAVCRTPARPDAALAPRGSTITGVPRVAVGGAS